MTEKSLPEESIFARAQELASTAERDAYVDRACHGDPTLRAEVEALLRADARSGDLLDLPEQSAATLDRRASNVPARRSARTSWSKRSVKAAWASSGWPSRRIPCAARWR